MTDRSPHRRLAALLAADVEGYSRHVGEDEEGTVAALAGHRSELIEPCIADHRGRLVKTTGDGLLAEFFSVVDAVRCAIAFQDGMRKRNADRSERSRLQFRIGINLGDVIVQDDDVFGDGVNVAARLEGLAAPGGICLSRAARDQVRDRLDIALEDMGEVSVKNIARPVRCFAVKADGAAFAAVPTPAKANEKPSIAILPFDNLSDDVGQDYFADGMAEDIITALSKLRWFFVIARNSSFAYKRKALDVRRIARELGVRYVLEGSVRKAGERMRIAAQLIDGDTGSHLWAERYDRQAVDIFDVQDEITRSVVGAIEPQLLAAENIRFRSVPPGSLDAWGCVIRGLWHLGRLTKDGNDSALELLRKAVSLDPAYAKAQAVLAFAEARRVLFGDDIESTLAVARGIAEAAIALDGDDPWGHFALGYTICFASEYDDAIACYRRAIGLNENFALAHGNMAASLALVGQPDEAVEAAELSLRMSPCDPFNFAYLHFAAIGHFAAGRHANGIDCEKRALRERPEFAPAMRFLAACHVGLGEIDEAKRIVEQVLKIAPESNVRRDAFGQVAYAREEDRERYAAALREAGLPEG